LPPRIWSSATNCSTPRPSSSPWTCSSAGPPRCTASPPAPGPLPAPSPGTASPSTRPSAASSSVPPVRYPLWPPRPVLGTSTKVGVGIRPLEHASLRVPARRTREVDGRFHSQGPTFPPGGLGASRILRPRRRQARPTGPSSVPTSAVGSKEFLITIGDRTVKGLTARDQMVGPWQVPVADVGVTCAYYAGAQSWVGVGLRDLLAHPHPSPFLLGNRHRNGAWWLLLPAIICALATPGGPMRPRDRRHRCPRSPQGAPGRRWRWGSGRPWRS